MTRIPAAEFRKLHVKPSKTPAKTVGKAVISDDFVELGKTPNPYAEDEAERILFNCIVKGVEWVEYDKGVIRVHKEGKEFHITIKQVA